MRYKHFKNADADISALTVGTWGIAGANSAGVTWGDVDTEESIAAIRQICVRYDFAVGIDEIGKKSHPSDPCGFFLPDYIRDVVFSVRH